MSAELLFQIVCEGGDRAILQIREGVIFMGRPLEAAAAGQQVIDPLSIPIVWKRLTFPFTLNLQGASIVGSQQGTPLSGNDASVPMPAETPALQVRSSAPASGPSSRDAAELPDDNEVTRQYAIEELRGALGGVLLRGGRNMAFGADTLTTADGSPVLSAMTPSAAVPMVPIAAGDHPSSIAPQGVSTSISPREARTNVGTKARRSSTTTSRWRWLAVALVPCVLALTLVGRWTRLETHHRATSVERSSTLIADHGRAESLPVPSGLPGEPNLPADTASANVPTTTAASTTPSSNVTSAAAKIPAAAPGTSASIVPAKAAARAATGPGAKRTLERAAADAVALGANDEAIQYYDELTALHPDQPVYKEAARILRNKTRAPQ